MNKDDYEIAAYCAAHNAFADGTSTWPIGEDINQTVTVTVE
jgi:hypothetical protein